MRAEAKVEELKKILNSTKVLKSELNRFEGTISSFSKTFSLGREKFSTIQCTLLFAQISRVDDPFFFKKSLSFDRKPIYLSFYVLMPHLKAKLSHRRSQDF